MDNSFNINKIKEKKDKYNNVYASLNILKGNGNKSEIDTICVNASIFLLLANKVKSLREGYKMAKDVLNSGKVWNLFLNVVKSYGGNPELLIKKVNEYREWFLIYVLEI